MAEISAELNRAIRSEGSWERVGGGLGKVLFGYGIFTLGLLLAGACVVAAIEPLLAKKALKTKHIWLFYLGGGIQGLASLAAWLTVINGQFECCMNVTERRGARWVIFFCLCCVVMGPLLKFTAWFGGLATPIRWNLGPEGFAQVRFTMAGVFLMAAGVISAGLYWISFWWFLVTVTACLEAPRARRFVLAYFPVMATAVALPAWLAFGSVPRGLFMPLLFALPGVWLFAWLYWVALLVTVKKTIEQTTQLTSDPLSGDAEVSGYQFVRA